MKKRLAEIRNALGLTQEKFGQSLSFTTNYIGCLECGANRISKRFISKLIAVFPQVNRDYLETGIGTPLKPEEPKSEPLSRLDTAKAFLLDMFHSLPPEKQVELVEIAKEIFAESKPPAKNEEKKG